jgi:ribosomal protein S18 acetylase RimI-like enzyme
LGIVQVASKKELREFILLPFSLYKDDPNWTPPLISEQKKMFNPSKNPTLKHCSYNLFLFKKEGRILGRIMAFVDHNFNKHWNSKIGFFGSFECENSEKISHELFKITQKWLKEQGMEKMRGSINLSSQEWGFIVKGFDEPAALMSPYNPPYYNSLSEKYNLQKIKDLLVYVAHGDSFEMPERFLKYTDLLIKKYNLTIRTLNMKNLKADVRTIVKISNESLSENWGYSPVSIEEADAIAKDLKLIIDPSIVFIVEADNQPIGFSLTFPDLNIVLRKLNGRLFPFNIFRLLVGIKKIQDYRIWALGVTKPFQKKGIDTILYRKTYEALHQKAGKVEANYVLEDNYPIKHAIEKLGFSHFKTYRIYEKEIE